ncbi:fumarylacetoacetate hydrolase family protein [Labrys sp. KB_33_2]|uniref:fumarylacetoacetate hydrolase family protein n=1 Tax=Labrys sp. KB_33_2 TaxID=3237479 RepID=UPI003F8F8D21
MRLVTINTSCDGQSGAIVGDEILNFSLVRNLGRPTVANWIPSTVMGILEGGPDGLATVDRLIKTLEDADDRMRQQLREEGALTPAGTTRLLAPIPRPRVVLATGGGYQAHIIEMVEAGALRQMPPPMKNPPAFFKNTNAIIGDGQPIVLPQNAPAMVDWECEVSFVIGRTCHNVSKKEALDHIVGHTLMNDVSARDWIEEFAAGKPETNILGKQYRSFCPIGPCIATSDEIDDPHDIDFELRLNGKIMQKDNVINSSFSIGDILSYYSQWITFQPGDIISRGSSTGVGFAQVPKLFLKSGDRVEMEATGIGRMTSPVIAAASPLQ